MQLVVRIIDKGGGSTVRGDVIEIVPDDHIWGRFDLTNPSWVVLRVPISKEEAETVKHGEDPETPWIRSFHLDLDALIARGHSGVPTKAAAERVRDRYEAQARGGSRSDAKHDPANALATEVVDVSAKDFRAAIVRKPAIKDREIIG